MLTVNFEARALSCARALTQDQLLERVPAAFAREADTERTSARYRFISTENVLAAMSEAGFAVTHAAQTRTRKSGAPQFSKHMLRFSHLRQSVQLVDAIPEIVLINAHNGTSAYVLRAGMYRPVCTNGLVTPIGDFGVLQVPHRGNVIENVVSAALEIAGRFDALGATVEKMAARVMQEAERVQFARAALALRYPDRTNYPITEAQLLAARREIDHGATLWQVFNVVQENLLTGGLDSRSSAGRATRTRSISQIREVVRLNVGLWELAVMAERSAALQ